MFGTFGQTPHTPKPRSKSKQPLIEATNLKTISHLFHTSTYLNPNTLLLKQIYSPMNRLLLHLKEYVRIYSDVLSILKHFYHDDRKISLNYISL